MRKQTDVTDVIDARITDDLSGYLICTVCGARAEYRKRKRFLARHPRLCLERRQFTSQVAQRTRHLDDLETNEGVSRV